jgi:Holliday junction resolvase RusA-like endonuclease
VNEAYATGKYGRRFKSKVMRLWEREMDRWALEPSNSILIQKTRNSLKGLKKTERLGVACVFWFEKSRIVCKDGSSKRLDLDNRAKATLDKLSKLIGIDDSRFWSVELLKNHTDKEHERADVEIKVL